MIYYVLTSKRYKRILITKSFEEAYEFITKNYRDVKIRKMNWEAKPKIVDRRKFLREFFNATQGTDQDQATKNKHRMFQMAELIIKGKTNFYDFLHLMDMKVEYRKYKELTKDKL